jgi:hypothetical protein
MARRAHRDADGMIIDADFEGFFQRKLIIYRDGLAIAFPPHNKVSHRFHCVPSKTTYLWAGKAFFT